MKNRDTKSLNEHIKINVCYSFFFKILVYFYQTLDLYLRTWTISVDINPFCSNDLKITVKCFIHKCLTTISVEDI